MTPTNKPESLTDVTMEFLSKMQKTGTKKKVKPLKNLKFNKSKKRANRYETFVYISYYWV